MVEYSYDEALALLESNVSTAKERLVRRNTYFRAVLILTRLSNVFLVWPGPN
jgi:hypothetical protein